MSSGSGPPLGVRVRHLLASSFELAVVGCLLLAAVGGVVAAGEATAPDTRTVQRDAANWTSNATFDHRATAREDAIVFERGQVLRNRSLYFTRVSPVLNGTYRYRHTGDADPATVTVDLRLVVRSVDPGAGSDEVFWRVEDTLNSTTVTAEAGDTVRVPFTVNVSEQTERSQRIAERLRSDPGRTQVVVVAETRSSTTLDGQAVRDDRTDRLFVESDAATYSVDANTSGAYTRTTQEAVTVPVPTDPLRLYGGALLAVLGLVGAAALVRADRTDRLALDAATVRDLERHAERAQFDEWISVGRVPATADEQVVRIDTLPDLVDVAIDSGRRVIEDPEAGQFVVLDGDTRYVLDTDDWVDELGERVAVDGASADVELPDDGAGDGPTDDTPESSDGEDDSLRSWLP
jgi:hypothetical protein